MIDGSGAIRNEWVSKQKCVIYNFSRIDATEDIVEVAVSHGPPVEFL